MPDNDNLELGPVIAYLEEDGSDVDVGYIGTATINFSSEIGPLTASRRGTSPIGKIVTGSGIQVVIEFKELTFDNFARVYPGAVVTGDGGRVDFINRVGLNLRDLAKQLTLKKIVGGVESVLAKDWFIVPEASPSPEGISLVYSADPGSQRILSATFDCWPNDTTGRMAYFGDELAS
jgi:hypothetical protein